MKYVDLKKGIILNEIERGNFNEFPYGTKLIECDGEYTIEPLELVPIDDQLAVPITILNLKGYKTDQCCAGHLDEGAAFSYIRFIEPIFKDEKLYIIEEDEDIRIQDNISITIDDDMKTIRIAEYLDRDNDLIKIQKDIDNFCQLILRWALALPDKTKEPTEIKVEDIGIIPTNAIPRMGAFINENIMLLGDKK